MNLKLLAPPALALALAACAPQNAHHPAPGDAKTLFGHPVESSALLDAKGQVTEIRVTLPHAALAKAAAEPAAAVLKLPDEVKAQTFFDHAVLFWMPQGLGPIEIPLFNFHFYAVSEAEVAKIDCADLTQPDPAIIPDGWTPPVPPGAPAKEFCVPSMGFHSGPADENPNAPFSKVMITGFYAGKTNFVEPIFIKKLLDEKQSFELPVPRPKDLTRAVLHPKKFAAAYDAQTDLYTFTLSDFVPLLP